PHNGVSSPSFSSSTPSSDADFGWIDAFCRAFSSQCRFLEVVDTHQARNNNALTIFSSWESIPWPALKRVCFHLLNKEDCTDLAHLAQVSTHFYSGVNDFMKRAENRPAIHNVLMQESGGTKIRINLIESNLPFHGLANLDWGRFERSYRSNGPALVVTLEGPQVPIWNQATTLLSSSIKNVHIHGDPSNPTDLSICETLLRYSTIHTLSIMHKLDDTNTSSIINIASRSTEFIIAFDEDSQLADPASFITRLDSAGSAVFSSIELIDSSSSFFGLPHSFWENYFNE
ncbi:hypothetical protein PMAYCL1PPCAC_27430, partial [Pristionchus mayeri]